MKMTPASSTRTEKGSKYVKPVPTQNNAIYNNQRVGLANLVSTHVLPEKYRSMFPFTNFNRMQSESFTSIYKSDKSCVISSPTGSGKTVLFELAIIKLLNDRFKNKNGNGDNGMNDVKILYMAPTKALCSEKYEDWCKKFQPLNCTVGLLTGDSSFVELDSIKRSNIIVCTPEKWDVLTRKWSDYSKLLDLVKLLLVDEIHFLREKRGTSLEVVITRMMTMSLNLRIIALSATVPNIKDVSNWLSGPNSEKPIETMIYDDTYRSVALTKTVYGYKTAGTNNPFLMEKYLDSKLQEVIKIHSKGKPVIIFCPTRNSSLSTAKYLLGESLQLKNGSHTSIPSGISKENSTMIQRGIAYHHAGLNLSERKFIEENFLNGNIKVLCSTSTLAVGVNLPAYLVVIKGTKIWNNGKMEEYNELDLMQMMGRAGRPQFEKEGACVIMTDATQKDKYTNLVKGTTKLESSLHLSIYENITAEITLKTISSLESAFLWLQSTFFYQRYLQNPTGYLSIFSNMNQSYTLDVQLKVYLKNILDELVREQIIQLVNDEYESTVYGKALSFSYVVYKTIKLLIKANSKMTFLDCLHLLSQSNEFDELRVKMNQKRLYKEINNNPLLLKQLDKKAKFDTPTEKVFLIIQYELGGIEFPKYQGSMKLHHEFLSEKLMIFKTLPRIMKAAIEIINFKKDAISLISMMKLNRCICAKSWETSSLLLRQIDGIGLAYAKKLMNKGIVSIEKAKSLTRDKLEFYLGLKPGAGQKIFRSIRNMPELTLKIENVQKNSSGKITFTVDVNVANNEKEIGFIWNSCFVHINVITDNSGVVDDFRRLPLKKLIGGKQFKLSCQLNHKSDYIKIHFNCDEIAGIGKIKEIDTSSIRALLPSKPQDQVPENDSFDFGDDDNEELNAVLGATSTNKIIKTVPDISKNRSSYKSYNSVEHNTSVDTSASFTECHHKCAAKETCRHICCKEGIPKVKLKNCKHLCKDKSKCRHMCCREQYEYEQKRLHKQESKMMRQNTLELSFTHAKTKVTMPVEAINLSPSPSKSQNYNVELEDIEYDSDENFVKLLKEKGKENNTAAQSSGANGTTALPLVLRRIEKKRKRQPSNAEKEVMKQKKAALSDTAIKFKKLTTSKFFNSSLNMPPQNKHGLLDSSSSDEFSDSFDSALEKAIGQNKMLNENSHNKFKTGRVYDSNILPPANSENNKLKLPRLNTSSNSRLANKKEDNFESVEDIVILNHNAQSIAPCRVRVYKTIQDLDKTNSDFSEDGTKDENKYSDHDSALFVRDDFSNDELYHSNNKKNDRDDEEESTAMTSGVDINHNPKEILNFLDSDIEFE